ncbi:tRNA-dihydrouridine synthase B [Platysternon megacephalum]|uniref:Podocin n=1 Tax=Platysternon megacephalum TaxID=55544 RepID=A0A4D9DCQ1_9SAUR|nr:tRNA-dihydrouridine synthase B [Platysternon megacephalum]
MEFLWVFAAVIVVVLLIWQSVKIIGQTTVALVERLGKFHRELKAGPHFVIPFVDNVRHRLDMREAVRGFPPQGVITKENLQVHIDSVIYYQITEPVRAAYEAQDFESAIEQLTMTTLRNIIGGLDLEQILTSRENINDQLRRELDQATGKWGVRVNRVELRAVDPPSTIRDAMEKGARAERDKRAAIVMAEGQRQSQILAAEGDRRSAILRAEGDREAAVLRAEAERQSSMLVAQGEAQAITTVFNAIHAGRPNQALLAYQYMQMLPQLAQGDANKVWVIPSELNDALKGLGRVVGDIGLPQDAVDVSQFKAPAEIDVDAEIQSSREKAKEAEAAVERAIKEANDLANPGTSGLESGHQGVKEGAQELDPEYPFSAPDLSGPLYRPDDEGETQPSGEDPVR